MDTFRKLAEIDLHADSFHFPAMTFLDIVSWVASGAMIFGGVVPYIPQYRSIRRTSVTEGFSTLVCFVLLLANLLRVFFWFGKRFELPLLAQSVLMIVAMLVMVELCVRVKSHTEILQSKQRHFKGFTNYWDFQYFWKWTDFLSYVECMIALAFVLAVTTYLLRDSEVYVEFIGFMAVFIEALLGTPQFYRNYRNKSTEGMSLTMVMMWMCGDTFKTGYFIARKAPSQFWMCGVLQICVDVAILSQVFYYSMFPQKTVLRKPAAS